MPQQYKFLSALIVGIWIFASLIILWRLPLGNGRDETFHLHNAEFYAQEKRFPVVPDDYVSGLTSIQGHQPPLYYMSLAALVMVGFPSPQSTTFYQINEFGTNSHLQTWDSHFSSPVVTWYMMRFISWLFSCVAVWAVYRAAVLLFADNLPGAVPLSMGILVLSPGLLVSGSTLNNNVPVLTWGALLTWTLVITCQQGLSRKNSVLLGFFWGWVCFPNSILRLSLVRL